MDTQQYYRIDLSKQKTPTFHFLEMGFVSQAIFPSSMSIRDGTYSTAFHVLSLLSRFPFEIYHIDEMFHPVASGRKNLSSSPFNRMNQF
jgi:hypothetical protein